MKEQRDHSRSNPKGNLSRKQRYGVGLILFVSLACNTAVLFLPFMQLRQGTETEPYTILRTVQMLWEAKLYVLSVLVVGFSILFPFAKLGVLAFGCLSRHPGKVYGMMLSWVHRLGKWSMLDVMLVCLILGLASGRLFVDTWPRLGLPIFVLAIVLSMASGEILSRAFHPRQERLSRDIKMPWTGVFMILLSGGFLGMALIIPFLKIDDWLMFDHSYSILTLAVALFENKALISGLVASLFLVIIPTTAWLMSAVLWILLSRQKAHERSLRWTLLLDRWSMLDVFGLALVVFLMEDEAMMQTDIRSGSFYLAVCLGLQWATRALLRRQLVPRRDGGE